MTLKYLIKSFSEDTEYQNAELKIKSCEESLYYLKKRLDSSSRVFFSRFGDGEFLLMMGESTRNHIGSPAYKKELLEAFKIDNPDYLIAAPFHPPLEKSISKGVYEPFGANKKIESFISEEFNFNEKKVFENHFFFSTLTVFQPKKIKSFLDKYIRPKKKMFIGGVPKSSAEKLYGKIDIYVETPRKNAYSTIDDWWPSVEKNVKEVDLIITSAGAASNVVAKRLWNQGYNKHVLDLGSVIDAIDRKTSRTWIRLKGHSVFKLLDKKDRPEFSKTEKTKFLAKDIKFFLRKQFI
ncbi:GT-D fold domain-containing protein [Sediminitomix flava]|uniref:Uncharacterized protein DUF1792 n=1 Tax=Sediminitomix flava TaxID=379075 RepID=A0A315ZGR6_SEDFL|nr:GT-D fold domain-containing protein [Sediminitomix flava]PWJ44359.1 uncharacterized protein DUF1792 [Sediminitomix flava]